jgi:hypothetical protein
VFTIDRPSERTSLDEHEAEGSGSASDSTASSPAGAGAGERVALPAVLAVAAFASLGAGAIHATAAGAHSEHRATVVAFVAIAVLQIGWGVLALLRPQRLVGLAGILINGAAVGGWVLAKTSGIGFISGLEESESAQFADTMAAGLAVAAIVGALLSLAPRVSWARTPNPFVLGVAALATLGLASPAMVQTGSHSHAGGHDDMAGMDHGHGEAAHAETAVPPQKYDGTLPVDFSGVPGVSAEEQAEAEALATRTIERLPQWADTQTAYDAGFRTIGDGPTGVEHYINWRWIGDDHVLNPDRPESLVYQVDGERRTLVAAMYMGKLDDTLETFPGIGGELIQSHIHNNLCFAGETNAWTVADVAGPEEECRPGTQRLGDNQVPMIHVWLTGHPCGPFAALEGVGGGQIAEGETVNCNHQHADPSANPEGEGLFAGGGGQGPRGS